MGEGVNDGRLIDPRSIDPSGERDSAEAYRSETSRLCALNSILDMDSSKSETQSLYLTSLTFRRLVAR